MFCYIFVLNEFIFIFHPKKNQERSSYKIKCKIYIEEEKNKQRSEKKRKKY